MSDPIHPVAPHHLPSFILSSPDASDGLLIGTAIGLIIALLGLGVLYFKLHALPEQLAHRGQKVQFQLVGVLALLALVSHNNAFWVAALLLAVMPIPDFLAPVKSIAQSLEKMAESDALVEPEVEPKPFETQPEKEKPAEEPASASSETEPEAPTDPITSKEEH
jgi:hypothetical protein